MIEVESSFEFHKSHAEVNHSHVVELNLAKVQCEGTIILANSFERPEDVAKLDAKLTTVPY